MYIDNQYKTYCIINTSEPTWKILNAMTHSILGLANKSKENMGIFEFLAYQGKNDSFEASISHYPIVILQAKNARQLEKAAVFCIENNVVYNPFCAEMFGNSAADQMEQTAQVDSGTANFIAMSFFGNADKLKEITKKYSSFKGFNPEPTVVP